MQADATSLRDLIQMLGALINAVENGGKTHGQLQHLALDHRACHSRDTGFYWPDHLADRSGLKEASLSHKIDSSASHCRLSAFVGRGAASGACFTQIQRADYGC
jgi:hypothetical protein